MATIDVVIPDLGEIVVAVKVVRWLKQPGEAVGLDENLVEISTDKIDVMLPSPAAGVLVAIRAAAGERVTIGAVIGLIEG